MDGWQDEIAQSLSGAFDRAVNAAVDVAIMKETGIKQGPTFSGNTQQRTDLMRVAQPGVMQGGAMPQWVPMLAIVAAVALVAWKLAK